VSGAILRSVVVALGVYVIALLFGATSIVSLPLFFFMVISVAIFFSLVGVLIGLWADSFEQLSVLNTFVITPLTYLGGMFNSLDMYPASLQKIALLNPFLYFVDGLRYSMIGVSSVNITTSVIMLIVMNTVMALIVLRLLSIGWKIRT
jgi:ABC-2 type transport system permease protein